jgi:prepilin peptidase CpaA
MSSIEGWIFGALLLVIPFALRGIGGGDVKLLAAAGAWGGPDFAFQTALLGALAGALVAIILLVVNGRLAETFRPVIRWGRIELALVVGSVAPSAVDWVAPPPTIDDSPPREKIWFPYGPVLAVGGLAALVLGNS